MAAIQPSQRLFVALDTPDEARALALCGQLPGVVGGVKVGNELFTVAGPAGAVHLGADYLVAGRPTTGADDPAAAARAVVAGISEAGP